MGGHVSSQLASWLMPITKHLQAFSGKVVHNIICLLLLLWLLVVLVQFLWFLLPQDTDEGSSSPLVISHSLPSSQKPIDIDKLKASHLFGEAGAFSQQQVVIEPVKDDIERNASKTKLSLLLEGIVYTPMAENSVAVIVYQGKQDQYYVGDKLPVGRSVSLAKVLLDHVILDNAGNYESLWLYDDEKQRAVKNSSGVKKPKRDPALTDKRNNQAATALASRYRERLYKNPSSLSNVLKISPAHNQGELYGYLVKPGSDRQQFTDLGFKAGDVVTAVNSVELDDPSRALEVYKLMRTAREASFTVMRDSRSIEIVVSLDDAE